MANPTPDTRRPTKAERVTVRFDGVEIKRLTKFASRKGVKVAALMRAAVLDVVEGNAQAPMIASAIEGPQVASRDLVALRVAVNKVGINVNQIARLSNKHGLGVITDEDDPTTYTQVLAETKAVLDEVKDALGGSRRP